MAEIIALIALAAFVVLMILFQKMGSWCTPRSSTAEAATTNSGGHAIIVPIDTQHSAMAMGRRYIPMTPPSSDDGCGTPRSDYAITVADDDSPLEIMAVRETRVISFIRFSGYTDSEASISERSTGLSFWSAFYSAKESECSAAAEVEPVDPSSAPPAHKQRSRPYIPRLHSSDDDGVDHVKIVALDGFAQRNILAFKPQKPRVLTTKRFKKPTFSRPPHVFLV